VQTASSSHSAELTIEGIKEFELLRDFLYARMRGVKDHRSAHGEPAATGEHSASSSEELTVALREVTHELRAIREIMETRERAQAQEVRDV